MIQCAECKVVGTPEEMREHQCVNIAPFVDEADERPTGKEPLTIGKWGMVSSFLVMVVGILAMNGETGTYASSGSYAELQKLEAIAFWWNVALTASGAFSVCFLLWCTGYIARAISFLDAR
ncbi:hypothetical protein PF049_00110 [Erythrobacteraceae bacterium WH01K]|nr:hypothetical protein PF049_00110 [Erythrobacteraceae bacterium WH01K]